MNTQTKLTVDARLERGERVPVTELKSVRRALIMKHGSLTDAAKDMGVDYTHLSNTLNGRLYLIHIVAAIQADLSLADAQVLKFWPLLRTWPRESQQRAVV